MARALQTSGLGLANRFFTRALAIGLLFAPMSSRAQDIQIPVLTRYATDLTGTLTPAQLSDLESTLSGFDRTTSTQIVMLMIPTLNGGSIEDVSLRIAEANKIGQKEKSNGVLLLIVKNDRQARIEVGYGLEGALPDITAGQIIRNTLGPHFRSGDYYGGISEGIAAIMAATKNEYQAEPQQTRSRPGHSSLILVLVVLFWIFSITRRFRRRGIVGGGFPWFFGGGGGFGGGGFGGGGGFSGGGGSFGGGGASGGW
ncbi:MAG TPA: TPM domain-containing protein [Bacteroidota bacterium]|nr:TPM domain-containing protein [Bacteroidota bacterium]